MKPSRCIIFSIARSSPSHQRLHLECIAKSLSTSFSTTVPLKKSGFIPHISLRREFC